MLASNTSVASDQYRPWRCRLGSSPCAYSSPFQPDSLLYSCLVQKRLSHLWEDARRPGPSLRDRVVVRASFRFLSGCGWPLCFLTCRNKNGRPPRLIGRRNPPSPRLYLSGCFGLSIAISSSSEFDLPAVNKRIWLSPRRSRCGHYSQKSGDPAPRLFHRARGTARDALSSWFPLQTPQCSVMH